ncbi:glycosyltransferase family 39 protein [Micromonospora purpureochromogenes]|uniref:Mannosyltransferase n=1 Tax=Micromonospora purpureochromogenes TaxID=47872 RepID=A0ABX2REV0_9ACTN|nr:glycosyltransferase family 39 protein [Micromonospora purpureochromogenes]NYF55042.1 mannosyltransferase [Micromonospora purpureochromogenes]
MDRTPDGPPWLAWALASPVALITLVVTYIGVGRQMWIDEHVTVYVTTLSWSEFTHLLGNQDLVHGLYYLVMRTWTAVFGTSLLALRLPSMIGMAVAAGAVTLLGRRLHSTAVGLAAGLFFVALPAVSRFGQEARSYAWVVALAALSTLALTFALDRPTRLRWLVYVLLMVTLTYLHFAAAMVALPHGLMAWYAWRRREAGQIGWWAATAGIVAVTAAPLLYLASRQSGQVSWIRSDWAAVQRYPAELFGSHAVFFGVALVSAVGAARLSRTRPHVAVPLLVWALLPPLLAYVTVDFTHLFLAKYALFTLPAWVLLAASAFASPTTGAGRAFSMPRLAGILAGVLVLSLIGVGGQREMRRSPLNGEPDFRAAAGVVEAQAQPGDGVVYVGTYRWARLPFAYELHGAEPVDVFAEVPAAQLGWLSPRQCTDPARCLGDTPRVWLVVSNYSGDDYLGLPAKQADLLRRQYHATSTSKFEHVRVVLLVRNAR